MAGSGLLSLGLVKLTDLVPYEGLRSHSYKLSVSTLLQSLALYFKGQSLPAIFFLIFFLKKSLATNLVVLNGYCSFQYHFIGYEFLSQIFFTFFTF